MPEIHGERLASLETEIRLIREAMSRMSETMDHLADNLIRIQQMEKIVERQNQEIRSHDMEFGSIRQAMSTEFTHVRQQMTDTTIQHNKLHEYVHSRVWVLMTITMIGSTLGGYVMQIIIKTVF